MTSMTALGTHVCPQRSGFAPLKLWLLMVSVSTWEEWCSRGALAASGLTPLTLIPKAWTLLSPRRHEPAAAAFGVHELQFAS